VEEKRVRAVAGVMSRAGEHRRRAAQRMKGCRFRKTRTAANASGLRNIFVPA
jgi:hypothetical protein